MRFLAPYEDAHPTLVELLQRACPELGAQDCYKLIGSGRAKVDGRVTKNPKRRVPPDARVEVQPFPTDSDFGVPDLEVCARREDLIVVDKAVGMPGAADHADPMNPVAFLADVLGMDRDTFTPVWTAPTDAGGPWLCAPDEANAVLMRDAIANGTLRTVWVAITKRPPRPTGELVHRDLRIRYAAVRMVGGLAELQLMPEGLTAADVARLPATLLDVLANADLAAVSDRERDGYMTGGGVRLRMISLYDDAGLAEGWVPPAQWWPQGSVVAEIAAPPSSTSNPTAIRDFRVSAKTLEVLRDGHPWILADRDMSDLDDFKLGELVRLRGPKGVPGPFALVDGLGVVAARVFGEDAEAAMDFAAEVVLRLDEAFAARTSAFADLAQTDLFRVVHGEADGLPGLYLDRVGPLYRATLMGGSAVTMRDAIYGAIEDAEPNVMVIEVTHTSDVRTRDELPGARVVVHGAGYAQPDERIVACEDGLRFWCEPWEGIDTGFFADQRDNRRRAVAMAQNGRRRWLNLFCHTGAFTVALVAAGAEVVSVDISSRYLDWLTENLELNDLDLSRNRNEAVDARQFVANCDGFDGIIIDPPTAAQSDAGFWSVQRDYQALVTQCFEKLNPEGVMLCCRNARKRKPDLEKVVRDAARDANVKLAAVEPAPPAADYPRMDGFPEGDSFEGVWAICR